MKYYLCFNAFCLHCLDTTKDSSNGLEILLDDVIREIPRKDSNKFFSQLIRSENRIRPNTKTRYFTLSPTKDERGTKKSTKAIPKPKSNPAISVALSNPNVYFVNLGLKSQVENTKKQEYNAEKRFRVPQSNPSSKNNKILRPQSEDRQKPKSFLKYDSIIYIRPNEKPESIKNIPDKTATLVRDRKPTTLEDITESHGHRTKRQEGSLPVISTIPATGIETLPVQTMNGIIPTQNIEGVRNNVRDINSNKIVAMVPVKVGTPLSSSTSVAMFAQSKL